MRDCGIMFDTLTWMHSRNRFFFCASTPDTVNFFWLVDRFIETMRCVDLSSCSCGESKTLHCMRDCVFVVDSLTESWLGDRELIHWLYVDLLTFRPDVDTTTMCGHGDHLETTCCPCDDSLRRTLCTEVCSLYYFG